VGDNGETIDATASRHPDVQRDISLASGLKQSMQAMADGGHDPEFDLPRSDDEETPEFASLHDLERYLPTIPPRYDDLWSVLTEQQQEPPKNNTNVVFARDGRLERTTSVVSWRRRNARHSADDEQRTASQATQQSLLVLPPRPPTIAAGSCATTSSAELRGCLSTASDSLDACSRHLEQDEVHSS